jgi:Kunitz/Bovine pancreatic trypsin inhibitor domain
MKFDVPTRLLMALCVMSAPVLGGADGGCTGGEVAIGGDPGAAGSAGTGDPLGSGGSSQATGGGPASGGSSNATGGGPAMGCEDEDSALRTFLADNKACAVDTDCQTQQVGCGIAEDGCTGAVYINTSADLGAFEAHRAAFLQCTLGEPSCVVCERVSLPPACIAGTCQPRTTGDVCSLPFEVGPCDAAFPVWAFVDGSCQKRTYGGCEGNGNRFNTLEECLAVCSPTTGECPPNRAPRSICIECGFAGGCGRMIDACALLCQTDDECAESNLTCHDGVCQVGYCI